MQTLCRFCRPGLAALVAVTASVAAAQAEIPAAIAAPGATPVAAFHAEGAQIYECKTASDGKLTWAFREPIATLVLDDKTVGRHYAGPTWEHQDGSAVTAKATGNAPGASKSDIAWLRLDVTGHRGSGGGLLDKADIVQRINTSGGALHGACERAGALQSVPYSADYIFLHAGG